MFKTTSFLDTHFVHLDSIYWWSGVVSWWSGVWMWTASSLMQAESKMAGELAIISKSIRCYKLFLTSILLYLLVDDVVWVLWWWMGLKGWCGSCDGSSHKASVDSKLAEVRSNHQAKHVDETMSHPHIASAPRRWYIKEAQGIGSGEGGRWEVDGEVSGAARRPLWRCWWDGEYQTYR
jgi:hypothetical protein